MELKTKKEYAEDYDNLLRRAEMTARDECNENGGSFEDAYAEIVGEFELHANTDEVVGHYVARYQDKALLAWKRNTEHLSENELTEQDREVTKILEQLYP